MCKDVDSDIGAKTKRKGLRKQHQKLFCCLSLNDYEINNRPPVRILSRRYGVPWPPDSSKFTEEVMEKLKRNAHYMIDAKVVHD
jgi:hypothetical protein